jgi:acyl-CoA thioesterase FadM
VRIPIRVDDVGERGAVSPTTLLVYLDELVGGWLRPSLADEWVTLHIELDLRAELTRAHGEVLGRIRLERIGRSSVTGRLDLTRPDGETAVEGLYVVAAWDTDERRARTVTEAERAILTGS